MPFRPSPRHRRNIWGVVYPLTEAIRRLYGPRTSDGALPIGAFYTVNVDSRVWRPAGGVWYQARSQGAVANRAVNNDTVELFAASVVSGVTISLPGRTPVDWEPVPPNEAAQLPALIV